MTSESSSRSREESRAFDSLPPAAKQRKALSLCKESDARSAGGYKSVAECNTAVLGGDFATIVKGKDPEPPKYKYSTPSTSQSPSVAAVSIEQPTVSLKTKEVAVSISSPKASLPSSSSSTKKKEVKLEKVADLSELSTAARKRRALAACKKSETRKFAKMGSESKCTEMVMKNDFSRIIEALEYGK